MSPYLKLDLPLEEDRMVNLIVEMVKRHSPSYVLRSWVAADLANCHLNACPLNLELMVKGDGDALHELDVAQDVMALTQHLDRPEGKLKDGWRPRFAL
jgi:hypothetical protein